MSIILDTLSLTFLKDLLNGLDFFIKVLNGLFFIKDLNGLFFIKLAINLGVVFLGVHLDLDLLNDLRFGLGVDFFRCTEQIIVIVLLGFDLPLDFLPIYYSFFQRNVNLF